MQYSQFLAEKVRTSPDQGLDVDRSLLNPRLYEFQKDVSGWVLRRGRAAVFAECGMGKTLIQLDCASQIPGRVIIFAPLAVAEQTSKIATDMGIVAPYCREDTGSKIAVSNYEMMDRFNPDDFAGIVIDESSILKAFQGKVRTQIIEFASKIPFRLACTATPSPNDYMELGNHAEFLGILSYTEMLATYFINDADVTNQWRLKKHGVQNFWKWISNWAIFLNSPADLGYDAKGFDLPDLNVIEHVIDVNQEVHNEITEREGSLFVNGLNGLEDRRIIRKSSIDSRLQKTLEIITDDKPWLIWCDFNEESKALVDAIPDAVEVKGSDPLEVKIDRLTGFFTGKYRVLVTKSSIAGFGMNYQHCADMLFFGISDSFERYYQAVRRCWRYGQTKPVNVHIVITDPEMAILNNLARKQNELIAMRDGVIAHTKEYTLENVLGASKKDKVVHQARTVEHDQWTMHHGDCVEVVSKMESNSIDYSIYSPPFADLYVYSDSDQDMGNCGSYAQFEKHFSFLVPELLRVIKPGRLMSFHCMNLPIAKYKEGYIGLRDFRGLLIKMFVDAGWIYHSEVCIYKDPVTAMQRTKALGLLHKQLKKDSAMSRQGLADYLVTMRKPGENPEPVSHTNEDFPVSLWQRYASPVWMDINPSETLQFRSARDNDDQRHICPLQLQVIERALKLWTNEGDLVLSPFAGIGSEGYVSLQQKRRFVGVELKSSYFEAACKNLEKVVSDSQSALF